MEVLRKGESKSKNKKLNIIEVGTLTIAMFMRHVSADSKDVANRHPFQYHRFRNVPNSGFIGCMKTQKTKFETALSEIFEGFRLMQLLKIKTEMEFQDTNEFRKWLDTLALNLEGLLYVTCKLLEHFEYTEPDLARRNLEFDLTLNVIQAVWDTLEEYKGMFERFIYDSRDIFVALADMTYEYMRVAYTYKQMPQSGETFSNWVKDRNERGRNLLPFRPYTYVEGEALKNYPGGREDPFFVYLK